MEVKKYELDADKKTLGRLATEISILLRGKNLPSFEYYKITPVKVYVKNASKIVFTGKKLESKAYYRHSGYLGSLKKETLKSLFTRKPEIVLEKAVRGMLPKNKLQDKWMKNLFIFKGEINGK